MRKTIVFSLALLSVVISCKEESKPKVKYDKPAVKVEVKQDTTRVAVSDLPVQLGNNILLYPIGELRVSDIKKSTFESEKVDASGFNVSNTMEDELTGYLQNLKFQEIGKDSLHVLTDKPLLIERVTLLRKKKLLVYVLADADTNQDGKVDSDDVKSLYISSDLGKNFTKLSSEMQELIDWNYIEAARKLFFRTIDDRNKNGAFDKNDGLHYFKVDLDKEWKAEEISIVK